MEDEKLGEEELQVLIGADERAERELAAAYARALSEEASQSEIEGLVEQVMARLRTGGSPYRDLIEWWQRFQELRIGREQAGQEEQAERLRIQILEGVGGAVEQYVRLRGNTQPIEERLRDWNFKGFWEGNGQALAKETRYILLSGEYVWYEYNQARLDDWAAPAIQYCRALEYEMRRRIYYRRPMPAKYMPTDPKAFKVSGGGWTLGTLKYLYHNQNSHKGDDIHNWKILRDILKKVGCEDQDFLKLLQRLHTEHIVDYRNAIAHGEPMKRQVAEDLRTSILGTADTMGILYWVARNLQPVQ